MRRKYGICVAALVLASCTTVSEPGLDTVPNDALLANVGLRLVFEDIPSSFWISPENQPGICLSFFLRTDGDFFSAANLKKIYVHNDAGHSWSLTPQFFDGSVGGWYRCYDPGLSLDRTLASLGKYTFDFLLADGTKVRKAVDVSALFPGPAPGYLYANAYSGEKKSDFLAMLSRPSVTAALDEGGRLSVRFSVSDSRIRNFQISFLDAQKHYIATRENFYNDLTKQASPELNDGNGFYTDGRENQLRIDPKDIPLAKDKTLQDLDALVLTVKDAAVQIPATTFVELQTKSETVKIGRPLAK